MPHVKQGGGSAVNESRARFKAAEYKKNKESYLTRSLFCHVCLLSSTSALKKKEASPPMLRRVSFCREENVNPDILW